MSWVFVNNTNAPVNIGIYNGSILYFHQNHVQPFSAATCKPAESVEADDWEGITLLKDAQGRTLIPDTCMANFDVYDVGYDIFITYDTPATELDSSSNWEAAENIASLTVGALLDVAGIAMIWAPGGRRSRRKRWRRDNCRSDHQHRDRDGGGRRGPYRRRHRQQPRLRSVGARVLEDVVRREGLHERHQWRVHRHHC